MKKDGGFLLELLLLVSAMVEHTHDFCSNEKKSVESDADRFSLVGSAN